MSRFVIVSDTGVIHGVGTAPFKWVSGLSDSEREAVQRGDRVFIRNPQASHWTQSGWKIVKYRSGKYFHREPSPADVVAFNHHYNRREV